MKFGFYVSREATRFRLALKENIVSRDNTAFVVVDYGEAPALSADCETFGIPLHRVSYEALGLSGKARNARISEVFLELLESNACDRGFLLGGRLLLEGRILQRYEGRLINFHPSLLPAYKGCSNAVDRALADNAFLLGNSAHLVNEGADEGMVIMQSIISSRQFTGYDTVLNLQLPMLRQIIAWLEEGRLVHESGRCVVRDADYSAGPFVPALGS